MTGSDETPADDLVTSLPQRQSRFFWTTVTLAIATMLLLCVVVVLIAAMRI